MSRVTEGWMAEAQRGGSGARSDEPEASSEVRWSARRKEGVVLRVLRGEALDLLAREIGGELSMEVDVLQALLERKRGPLSPRRCR